MMRSIPDRFKKILHFLPFVLIFAFSSIPVSAEVDKFLNWLSVADTIDLPTSNQALHPDRVFQLSAVLKADNVVDTKMTIMETAYIYRDKVDIKMVSDSGYFIDELIKPIGKQKNDEFFGLTEVYHDRLNIPVTISAAANSASFYTLAYSYQGCIEDSICYPPMTRYLHVDTGTGSITISDQLSNATAIEQANQTSTTETNTQPAADVFLSEQDQYAQLLQDKSLLLVVWLFFIAGIALTFTPCVFPLIPILSSIIAGQGKKISTRSAFFLSLVYVLSMAITYAIIGAIVGYYGAEYNIQIAFQNPIILSVFSAIFILLALSMFGFYELQMPSMIQNFLTSFSRKQKSGRLVGTGIMGFFSAIIVGPCITAPLVGALIFISLTQNWLLGGLALFALGIGMGVPLLLVGTSAGKFLPRAGDWMVTIKAIFGVAMLVMVIWLLERVLPTSMTMALIAILAISSSIYMGALEKLPQPANGWRKLCKGLGIILLVYGVVFLIGAAAGSKDLIQPLKGIGFGAANQPSQSDQSDVGHINFKPIKGVEGFKTALDNSVANGKFIMLDFYADWCISCKKMERFAFTHPQVLALLEDVTTLQTDVTNNDSIDTELMNTLGIYGPPAILFFDIDGKEIRNRRIVGEMSGEDFAAHIDATFY